MKLPSILLSTLFLLSVHSAPSKRESALGALYFFTNDIAQENRVAVYSILPGGDLTFSKTVSTGGVGSAFQNQPANTPDGLHSQGSVALSGTRLFVANAGSNSVSVFDINPDDPTDIQLLGGPIPSGGDFPSSIAVSTKTGNVCVVNAGVRNGVQCFSSTSQGLSPIPNGNRGLNLAEVNPPVFNSTAFGVSHIIFSEDESKLIVSVRGSSDGSPGFLVVWNVNPDGSLAEIHEIFPAPTRADQQNFGLTFIKGTEKYIVGDPSQGAVLYDFSAGFEQETFVSKNFVIEGQSAVCWISFASKSNSFFLTDIANHTVYEYAFNAATFEGTQLSSFALPTGSRPVDTAIGTFGSDQFLFQIAPGIGTIFVFDVEPLGKTEIIHQINFTSSLENDGVGITATSQGMVVFVI